MPNPVIDNNAKNTACSDGVMVAQMDQRPKVTVGAQSPLAHADFANQAKHGRQQGGVYLQEHKLLGHMVLRGNRDDIDFSHAIASILGVPLPPALTHHENGELSIRWISPDEWLVILPDEQTFALEARLREALTGHFSIVNVSGAQTLLTLSGSDARSVLQKSTGYDVHPSNFAIGKSVTTTFAKTQCVLCRHDEDSWQIVVRRSFADYLWLWLQDASAEFGLVIRQ